MQVYNTTTQANSIIHEAWDLCSANITSYPLADIFRRLNYSLEELVAKIIMQDGTFEYDDTNHTDLPIGSGTLVEAQQSYTFASEYLMIKAVKVKNKDGKWQLLDPIDQVDLNGVAIEEYFADTGMPTHYDKIGDTIKLYPAPTATSVTLVSGIKVDFKRTVDLFTVADTTQEPGLPSPYHVLLAYMVAIPYCMKNHKDRVALYQGRVNDMTDSLLKHYARRETDKRNIIRMKPINFR